MTGFVVQGHIWFWVLMWSLLTNYYYDKTYDYLLFILGDILIN